MKKYIILLIASISVLSSSCQKNGIREAEDDCLGTVINPADCPVFTASFENGAETKTYLNENGYMRWNGDDQISIFAANTCNMCYDFKGEDGSNYGTFCLNTDQTYEKGTTLTRNYAFYPYQDEAEITNSNGELCFNLPPYQEYEKNSFAKSYNPMAAATEDASDHYLRFTNLCGYLRFSFYGDCDIQYIAIHSKDNLPLNGKFSIAAPAIGLGYESCNGLGFVGTKEVNTDSLYLYTVGLDELGKDEDSATDYWFVLPPGTYSSGFSIDIVTQTDTIHKVLSSSVTINRNEVTSVAPRRVKNTEFEFAVQDQAFRTYIADNFDYNGDDIISLSEIDTVTSISCASLSISSLSGIENFKSLTTLDCANNPLTTLDVSNNTALTSLICNSNQLTSLDVSGCTALTTLTCNSNQLTSLNVSNNTALTSLICNSNQLTSLDVSGCTALTTLTCSSNQLTSLDVSSNTALITLTCPANQLTSLNVSGCNAITKIYCYSNKLKSLDLSNLQNIRQVNCFNNSLENLNLSGCSNLYILYCYNNLLTSLDVSECKTTMSVLDCSPMNDSDSNNLFKTLYVKKGQRIHYVYNYGSRIASYIPAETEIVVKEE